MLSQHLKPRHITLLLSLDRTGHLGRTAEALNMSQPAASKSLAQLEEQIGQTLFERTGTGTRPTAIGELVIAHAKNLAGAADRLANDLKALQLRHQRVLRLGVLPSASIHIAPQLVSTLLAKAPDLDISIHEGLLHDLLDGLLDRRLDCVIGRTTSRIDSNQVEGRFLHEDPVSIVCGTGNPFARRRQLSPSDLAACMWILPIAGTVMSDRMDEMFDRMGTGRPARYIQSNAVHTNIQLINTHPWVSALPGVIAEYFQDQGHLRILPVDTRVHFGNMQVLVRKESNRGAPVQMVLDALAEMFSR
ncbi:LysR family transcriptional regulator [Allopusillimonas ginsengisoli]|uniref:LysR family transcriptional regulator n=1 Tax=Allopusillimonas ginsengisoli TaxID=453575 RepID=UPI00101F9A6E|nr:LysR substrate-binding domain-containing protein [Allopusillimonas ginsengisoli]TEA79959.1 LysR family transcriptional regulator [Allopusillimonas ginsengisoli]